MHIIWFKSIYVSVHHDWVCAHMSGFKWPFLLADLKHLSSAFTLDNSNEKQRICNCPHPSSRCVSVISSHLEPITLDQGPSIHTSQNRSINKSPPWYLGEARDLRLPLCLVEFVRPLGATLCASGGLGVLKSHLNHNPLRSKAMLEGQCSVVKKKDQQVLGW